MVLVKINQPFLVVENQTKRKTESVLSFFEDERSYGADAMIKRSRNPHQTFTNLHDFLGKKYSDETYKNYLDKYFRSYDIAEDKVAFSSI